jgi:nitrogen fixation protein FixH
MYLAVGDPSGAVVPQYHQAALNWDATHRASLASQRLGWTVQIVASDVADASGQRAIEITIHDRQGNAVDELQLVGKIYHHARAADVQTIDLPAVGDGRYLTVATMPRSGLWQIDVDIRGTGEQITEAATIEIN